MEILWIVLLSVPVVDSSGLNHVLVSVTQENLPARPRGEVVFKCVLSGDPSHVAFYWWLIEEINTPVYTYSEPYDVDEVSQGFEGRVNETHEILDEGITSTLWIMLNASNTYTHRCEFNLDDRSVRGESLRARFAVKHELNCLTKRSRNGKVERRCQVGIWRLWTRSVMAPWHPSRHTGRSAGTMDDKIVVLVICGRDDNFSRPPVHVEITSEPEVSLSHAGGKNESITNLFCWVEFAIGVPRISLRCLDCEQDVFEIYQEHTSIESHANHVYSIHHASVHLTGETTVACNVSDDLGTYEVMHVVGNGALSANCGAALLAVGVILGFILSDLLGYDQDLEPEPALNLDLKHDKT